MPGTNERFKRTNDPRKKQPVKRVKLSDGAKRAYEEAIQKHDERERDYIRHRPGSEKN